MKRRLLIAMAAALIPAAASAQAFGGFAPPSGPPWGFGGGENRGGGTEISFGGGAVSADKLGAGLFLRAARRFGSPLYVLAEGSLAYGDGDLLEYGGIAGLGLSLVNGGALTLRAGAAAGYLAVRGKKYENWNSYGHESGHKWREGIFLGGEISALARFSRGFGLGAGILAGTVKMDKFLLFPRFCATLTL